MQIRWVCKYLNFERKYNIPINKSACNKSLLNKLYDVKIYLKTTYFRIYKHDFIQTYNELG
jgi:hypothetical protein